MHSQLSFKGDGGTSNVFFACRKYCNHFVLTIVKSRRRILPYVHVHVYVCQQAKIGQSCAAWYHEAGFTDQMFQAFENSIFNVLDIACAGRFSWDNNSFLKERSNENVLARSHKQVCFKELFTCHFRCARRRPYFVFLLLKAVINCDSTAPNTLI